MLGISEAAENIGFRTLSARLSFFVRHVVKYAANKNHRQTGLLV
jgi:hypothetical protein